MSCNVWAPRRTLRCPIGRNLADTKSWGGAKGSRVGLIESRLAAVEKSQGGKGAANAEVIQRGNVNFDLSPEKRGRS